MESIISIIGLVLGGGGLGFFFNYLISNRKTDQSEFEILLGVWKEERIQLKEERKELMLREKQNSEEILELRQELSNLKSKMVILESAHLDLPLAQAVKDLDGKFVLANPIFEKNFIKPHGYTLNDCIGSDGVQIWGEELMEDYAMKERQVVVNNEPMHFVEDGYDIYKQPAKFSTFRYPIYLGDKIIATGLLVLERIVEHNIHTHESNTRRDRPNT